MDSNDYPFDLQTDRFSSLDLQTSSPRLWSASLTPIAPNTLRVVVAAQPGETLQGNQQIAVLNFVSVSNQTSAFVPVAPRVLQATIFDGSPVSLLAVHSGRIVFVGDEPLLEALRSRQGQRTLALYGKPWSSYAIEYSTSLSSPDWRFLLRFPMTNLVQTFSELGSSSPAIYYRAYEFAPDPPLLEARLAGPNRSLLAYGRARTDYSLQFATNLSGVVSWYPLLNFALTNSFQILTNLGNSEPVTFYRLKRP